MYELGIAYIEILVGRGRWFKLWVPLWCFAWLAMMADAGARNRYRWCLHCIIVRQQTSISRTLYPCLGYPHLLPVCPPLAKKRWKQRETRGPKTNRHTNWDRWPLLQYQGRCIHVAYLRDANLLHCLHLLWPVRSGCRWHLWSIWISTYLRCLLGPECCARAFSARAQICPSSSCSKRSFKKCKLGAQ